MLQLVDRLIYVFVAMMVYVITLAHCSEARAQEIKPIASVQWVHATFIEDGDAVPLPVEQAFSVGGLKPLDGWALYGEVAMVTATDFEPSFWALVGPSWMLTDQMTFGVSGLYRYNPDYGAGDSHVVAFGLAPGWVVSEHVSIAMAFSLFHQLEGSVGVAMVPLLSVGL